MIILTPRTTVRRRGFTLLEVILAVTIFGLTMIAITMVMRTGTQAWTTGHGLSELMTTARVTQDVIVRDLNNTCYRRETEYNLSFRRQLETIGASLVAQTPLDSQGRAQRMDPRIFEDFLPDSRVRDDNPDQLRLDRITPPLDLSFRGEDGGKLDRVSFVRRQTADWANTADGTGGLRRISYYVKDGVLWREESDPYGFRPGAGQYHFARMFNPEVNIYDPGSYSGRQGDSPLATLARFYSTAEGEDEERGEFLPPPVQYVEPMCEGVEIFDITYGYFLEGQWVEVTSWDSNAQRYRTPFDQEYMQALVEEGVLPATTMYGGGLGDIRPPRNETRQSAIPPILAGMPMQMPDDLPGYMAIQLGLRPAAGSGRLRQFTIFHSLTAAEETDIHMDEQTLRDADRVLRELTMRRDSRRRDSRTDRFERGAGGLSRRDGR